MNLLTQKLVTKSDVDCVVRSLELVQDDQQITTHLLVRISVITVKSKENGMLEIIDVTLLKLEQWFDHTVMCPKDAKEMVNSVDPYQTVPETAPLRAV